jgi:hypothetical protein
VIDCSVCGSGQHTALYCPNVVEEDAIQRRLEAVAGRRAPKRAVVVRRVDVPDVREVVTQQLTDLTRDLDGWHGVEERPTAPPAVDETYDNAFAVARKNCGHRDVDNVEYRRVWYCIDCRQYLSYRQMYDIRGNHKWWSW